MTYPIRSFDYARIVNVVDGDTCDIEVDLGFSVKVKHRFRLAGINTPERGQPGWQEATDYLRTFLNLPVIIHSIKLDKYGRYLAVIFEGDAQRTSINDRLLALGLAVPYV